MKERQLDSGVSVFAIVWIIFIVIKTVVDFAADLVKGELKFTIDYLGFVGVFCLPAALLLVWVFWRVPRR